MENIVSRFMFISLVALALQACTASVGDTRFSVENTTTAPKAADMASVKTARDPNEYAKTITPPVFKEPVIVSNGYANISAQLSDNPSQRRLMAIRASKIDAYRNLTEKVYGQNIDATTTVEDMVATNDAIRARVQGLIYGARLVSISPIGGDSYETRLELSEKRVNEIRNLFLFRH